MHTVHVWAFCSGYLCSNGLADFSEGNFIKLCAYYNFWEMSNTISHQKCSSQWDYFSTYKEHTHHSWKHCSVVFTNEAITSTGKLHYKYLHSQWVGIYVMAKTFIYKRYQNPSYRGLGGCNHEELFRLNWPLIKPTWPLTETVVGFNCQNAPLMIKVLQI